MSTETRMTGGVRSAIAAIAALLLAQSVVAQQAGAPPPGGAAPPAAGARPGGPPAGGGGGPPGMMGPPEVDHTADCDRACLRAFADNYLKALVAHDPTLLPVSQLLRVGENSHAVALGDNIWKTVKAVRPERIYVTDPYAGQVLVLGALEMAASEPFIYAIRLKLEKGKLLESETQVTSDKISGQHFRPDLIASTGAIVDAVVPEAQRHSRADLLALARVQWGLQTGSAPNVAKTCMHDENWESPMGGTPCNAAGGGGLGRMMARNYRTPIVDTEKGIVVNYQLQDAADPQPRDPPPGEKTPVFYYRPLTFYVVQLAKFSGNDYLIDAMFMNLQELGAPIVFRR